MSSKLSRELGQGEHVVGNHIVKIPYSKKFQGNVFIGPITESGKLEETYLKVTGCSKKNKPEGDWRELIKFKHNLIGW